MFRKHVRKILPRITSRGSAVQYALVWVPTSHTQFSSRFGLDEICMATCEFEEHLGQDLAPLAVLYSVLESLAPIVNLTTEPVFYL